MATKQKVILAPQEFVDCAPNPKHCGGDGGCEGSTPDLLFEYAIKAGATTETSYPYAAKITGYQDVKTNDYDSLMAAIAKQPVTIGVAADKWGLYSKGVFPFKSCGTDIDHAVLLVGYGTDSDV